MVTGTGGGCAGTDTCIDEGTGIFCSTGTEPLTDELNERGFPILAINGGGGGAKGTLDD